MKLWRGIVVVALTAALAVILSTAYLEAAGRLALPWPPLSRQILGPGRSLLRSAPASAVSPYVEAVVGLALEFLIGVFVLYTAPQRMRRLSDAVSSGVVAPFRYLVLGTLMAALLGAVALLSAYYVHTFPLAFVLGVLLFLAALAGSVAIAFGLGRALLRRAGWAGGSPLWALSLGTALLYAAIRLPIVAPAAVLVLAVMGAGAAISTRFGGLGLWSLEALREVRE